MNDHRTLSKRLHRRFKDVPYLDEEDTEEWIETAMNEHGFDMQEEVPSEYVSLVLLYAEADGAAQIALRTASFFSFVDKDESIDKTNIAAEYRRMAKELWRRYDRKRNSDILTSKYSKMSFMTRIDR